MTRFSQLAASEAVLDQETLESVSGGIVPLVFALGFVAGFAGAALVDLATGGWD